MPDGKPFIQSVLIVDDEPMARTLLRLMLVRSGYEVIEAEDGFAALDKIRSSTPDLVILDVMMPGMDGLKVCASIRQDLQLTDLPIILLSAKSDIVGIHEGLDVGANKYLTKPVSPEELSRHVREVLDKTQNGAPG
ncbi:MAG: response regulator [Ardenticatenaceae bacterium]|nr:response regulator [Ardenticatenaceae bacterium]